MPTETDFAKLSLYGSQGEDLERSFLQFRTDIAGTGENSNFRKIDKILQDHDNSIQRIVLYSNDNGTKEDFTLSQPYTDFTRIGVYAKSQHDIDSVYNEIYTSTTNKMTLACTTFQDGDHYNMVVWRLAHIFFEGNEVKFDINGAASFPNGDNKYTGGPNTSQPDGSNDGIKIVRVVGYR